MSDKFGLSDNDLSGIVIIKKTKGENMKHPIEAVLDNYGDYLKAITKWAEAGNVYAVPTPPPLTKAEQTIREIVEAINDNGEAGQEARISLQDVIKILIANGYYTIGSNYEQEYPYGNA